MTQAQKEKSVYQQNIGSIMEKYLELQITCMVLHHVGLEKIKAGDTDNGEMIVEAVEQMRKSLYEQKTHIIANFNKEEIDEACADVKFNSRLYLALSDAVFADNQTFFNTSPRPEAPEYVCDSELCEDLKQSITQEYFPTLLAA